MSVALGQRAIIMGQKHVKCVVDVTILKNDKSVLDLSTQNLLSKI
jgi:hypothetical protein